MANRQNLRERTIEDAELDRDAAKLRSKRLTYRQIADEMGSSVTTAHDRVRRALATVPREAAEELMALEMDMLDRLDREALTVLSHDHVKVTDGGKIVTDDAGQPILDDMPKLRAIDALRRNSESRRRLKGIDAPTRRIIEVVTEDVVDAELRSLDEEHAALIASASQTD